MKTTITAILIVIFLAVGSYFLINTPKQPSPTPELPASNSFDGKNITFAINIQPVTLVDGKSEVSIATSSGKVITRYFGNEVVGDLSGDGLDDVAFLVTQEPGGSGVFYYAVVAVKIDDGYKTTNAFLVGDRIAPQSNYIPINTRELHINFAERRPGEPMTTQSSSGAVLLLKVTPEGVLEGLMK